MNTEAVGENTGKVKCGVCGAWSEVVRNRKVNECENCIRLRGIANDVYKQRESNNGETIQQGDYVGQTRCELTGISMESEKGKRGTATRASLTRMGT